MPRRLRRRTRRRLWQAAAVVGVLAAFLAVWSARPGRNAAESAPVGSPSTTTPVLPTATPTVIGATPKPISGSLSGFPFPIPSSSRVNSPGPHDVVLEVTSDHKLGTVGYQTRSGKRAVIRSGGSSSFRLTDQVPGPGLLVVLAVQVGPDAKSATCKILVDGAVASVQTARGPNRVVVCLA